MFFNLFLLYHQQFTDGTLLWWFSGLDKDQWVFHLLLSNLMSNFTPFFKYQLAENAKPCKMTQYLLNTF